MLPVKHNAKEIWPIDSAISENTECFDEKKNLAGYIVKILKKLV